MAKSYYLLTLLLLTTFISFTFAEGEGETPEIFDFKISNTSYYQEKYFRFLSNKYEEIESGDFWTTLKEEKGIGFKATDDFGSFILVKDWAMFNFKLKKIVFRPYCSYTLNGHEFDAEMLLIHTIDNGYYPPGKRIYLGINYLVISVPFKKTSDLNPANDKLFHFMSLDLYKNALDKEIKETLEYLPPRISPFKSIKLHQIIQHQPSLLFESDLTYSPKTKALYMIFTQFHFISEKDHAMLNLAFNKALGITNETENEKLYLVPQGEVYRNWQNPEEVAPKATLMAYNRKEIAKISLHVAFIIIAVLL